MGWSVGSIIHHAGPRGHQGKHRGHIGGTMGCKKVNQEEISFALLNYHNRVIRVKKMLRNSEPEECNMWVFSYGVRSG